MTRMAARCDDSTHSSLTFSMATVATALADTSRMHILCALMDGRAWTATELSVVADVAPSTTSGHLNKLTETGLLTCVVQGRHRYYRLASHEVAGLLENLMGISTRPGSVLKTTTPDRLRRARTCYDHLAGEIAVGIYDAMQSAGWLMSDGTALTMEGKAHFAATGIELTSPSRRKPCCPCLDWSERRFHLGGEAGAALLRFMIQKAWLQQTPGYRELSVTARGQTGLSRIFNLRLG